MTTLDFVAAGGNRHPSAADWKPGLLAFGAGQNVALWNPEDESCRGITALLRGHTDVVNTVKIVDLPNARWVISGGADKTIRIWTSTLNERQYVEKQCLKDHSASVNTMCVLASKGLLVTGSADGSLCVWHMSESQVELVQSISLKKHYLPLASALFQLDERITVLAVGGTSSNIQVFVQSGDTMHFELQATLTGHEGWIRSLDFVERRGAGYNDVILASASQDKYIRLWRLHPNWKASVNGANGSTHHLAASTEKSLSNKLQQVGSETKKYNVSFEALLVGHEDWIYTAKWAPQSDADGNISLLSASADNSLAIWEADTSSGIWVCKTRLGEISAQKGSTTATGSTGGFWIGLWQPGGQGLASLGRTGSWRKWQYDSSSDVWAQRPGISGHTQAVQSLAWASNGSYLVSTGSDQTTRLYAEWKVSGRSSWHEFARPQIHGYDLNCIDAVSTTQIISGAEEKLLRVFNKPKATEDLLYRLAGVERSSVGTEMPGAASVPVLGLSNKTIDAPTDEDMNRDAINGDADLAAVRAPASELDHPPFEENLARSTLWPEHEKLYGHGYEISAVAASHDGELVATACKASSLDHAVIRLYECREWREIKPPLTAHSLTVTALHFSADDRYLLSVGRDRQWSVFERAADGPRQYELLTSDPKGHSRMILNCSWAPTTGSTYVFATAGRDKAVRIWHLIDSKLECAATITATAAITAVSFTPYHSPQSLRLAYGTEEGAVHIVDLFSRDFQISRSLEVERHLLPSGAIHALKWRPRRTALDTSSATDFDARHQLAVASEDASVRIYDVEE